MSDSVHHSTDVLSDAPVADAVLELDGLCKRFGTETVIEDLDLQVREGEILTLLGPSGCGKTTTLRLVAGLERPDEGTVRLRGETVSGADSFVAPERRGVGVVFQEFALFPHLTARENIAFGLDDWGSEERERRVAEMLDLVGLEGQGESYPDELSGGQQQRVALARSLAPEPRLLLLDEPFSNLDVDLRVRMREEVRRILKRAGVTAVSVTHDQEEAMSISDRVAVMNDGRIEQVGDPEQVFQHPESRFVAGFLGHASFLAGYVRGEEVRTDIGPVPREQIHGLAEEYDLTGIDVLVRPDDLRATPLAGEAVDAPDEDEPVAARDDGEPGVEEDAADRPHAAADGSGLVDGGDRDDSLADDAGSGGDGAPADDTDRDRDGVLADDADGRVVARRYLGPTILYEVELTGGDRVQCMHNHDEHVPLDTPVAVSLRADHELSWFPRDQREDAPADD